MIPDAALQQHLVILGKTGSGKSFAARGIVERLLDLGRRVCILDYTGVWSGLRSNAAGDGPGYPVVIFGGEHADVPLTEGMAAEVARFVASEVVPTIIDLDGMTVGAQHRFVTAFCEELYRANTAPLHLVIEEIDELAPQTGAPGAERMIGAVCRIFQRGRSKGFRAVAITQRPANVHKRVLAQCNTMIALRLVAPQDRKAIADWIRGHGDDATGKRVIDSLPRLARGEGWIWAPEQDVLERTTFPPIKTFDSMRAPEDGEERKVVNRAAIDLPGIRARFELAEQEAQQNDPKALKARIAELERQVGKQGASAADLTAARQASWDEGREVGYEAGQREALDRLRTDVLLMKEKASQVIDLCNETLEVIAATRAAPAAQPAHRPLPPAANAAHQAPSPVKRSAPSGPGEKMPAGERAILIAVAQHGECSREQLSILTGYKRSSRDAYIQRLAGRGLVAVAGTIRPTEAGIKALGSDYEPLPTGRALQRHWLDRLPEGERAVLQLVLDSYPAAVERAEIDKATGYKRSSRDAYIQRLRTRQLVTITGRGEVRASDSLF